MSPAATIRANGLHAFYGESHILHGVDFEVSTGEVVALLGRNGAGRTTTLRALLGLINNRTGSVLINGQEAIGLPRIRSPDWVLATARKSAASTRASRPRKICCCRRY